MDGAATDHGAVVEAASFLCYFNDLSDPRRHGKVTCPGAEVLLPAPLGVLAEADSLVRPRHGQGTPNQGQVVRRDSSFRRPRSTSGD